MKKKDEEKRKEEEHQKLVSRNDRKCRRRSRHDKENPSERQNGREKQLVGR